MELTPPIALPEPCVGPRVRALRESLGLSLRELAARSGVSAPMLSQVERGETSPSLAVATRVASGLELSLSQLLRLDEGEGLALVRVEERRHGGSHRAGHHYEVLTPPLPGQRAELSEHRLEPGAATGGPDDPPMHEPGARETAVVTAGRLRLICNWMSHELSDTHAVSSDADLPHDIQIPSGGEKRMLAVVCAGLRSS